MLTTPNCSLLFQVILAIFVPYFYPEAKNGVDFRGLDSRLWCKDFVIVLLGERSFSHHQYCEDIIIERPIDVGVTEAVTQVEAMPTLALLWVRARMVGRLHI